MARYLIYMPSSTSYYTEICRLGARLEQCSNDARAAKLRPMEASNLVWVTANETVVAKMRRLGALIVPYGEAD